MPPNNYKKPRQYRRGQIGIAMNCFLFLYSTKIDIADTNALLAKSAAG